MQRSSHRVIMCAHPSINGGRRTSRVKSAPIPEEEDDETSQEEEKLLHVLIHNHDKASTSTTCDHAGECDCSNPSATINDSAFVTARTSITPSNEPHNSQSPASAAEHNSSDMPEVLEPSPTVVPAPVRKFFSVQSLRQFTQRRSSSSQAGGRSDDAEGSRVRFISESGGELTKPSATCPEFHSASNLGAKHDIQLVAAFKTRKRTSVKKFYKNQQELLESFKRDAEVAERYMNYKRRSLAQTTTQSNGPTAEEDNDDEGGLIMPYKPTTDLEAEVSLNEKTENNERYARLLAQVSLLANICLLLIKMIATCISGSYSIISSLVDSCVDLTSGSVIWMTERAIRKRDPYRYPRGRTRLEPLALIIISVVMSVASIQVIVQSVEAIVSSDFEPNVHIIPIALMLITIAVKLALFAACWSRRSNASVGVLAQDHRNDCISNTVAIACAYAGSHFWKYIDPIGAILVSIYIAVTWFITGYDQIKMVSGRAAAPSFINRVIKVCVEHDERILAIDTVLVYHFGTRFLVEVHVICDGNMPVREAHDIIEPLTNKLERLDYIERAFIHVDYEATHRPEEEHRP